MEKGVHITRVTYSRTFALAQYESEKIELEATIDIESSATTSDVLMELRTLVAEHCTKRLQAKAKEKAKSKGGK